MKENSRIRFNPVTKEIEVEGSETFVKTYFDKLQAMISGAPEPLAEGPRKAKTDPGAAGRKGPKAGKAAKRDPGAKKVTQIDTVVGLIQGSAEGISTADLKDKTGLVESQIWSIVNRAAKLGKIKKMKRGVYGPA